MKYFGCFWDGFKNAIACILGFALGILFCALLGSCASSKHAKAELVQIDSTSVEVRVETVYVPDTVYIEIPAQTAERTTTDSTSHLETDYAESDARINPDGTLYHSLANKPQDKPVEFQKPVVTKDSVRTEIKWRTRTVTKEVERKKTWWEQTKSYGFYVMVLFLLWSYRKEVISLARKVILKV